VSAVTRFRHGRLARIGTYTVRRSDATPLQHAPEVPEPIRPAQPVGIIEKAGVIGEPHQELSVVPRVVLDRSRVGCLGQKHYSSKLPEPHSYGYPLKKMLHDTVQLYKWVFR
jgi:hypothetical protein